MKTTDIAIYAIRIILLFPQHSIVISAGVDGARGGQPKNSTVSKRRQQALLGTREVASIDYRSLTARVTANQLPMF
jgi:hypothetical protein